MKSSPLIWPYVVNVKSTVQILLIIMAFLENMNFKREHGAEIARKIPRRLEFCKKLKNVDEGICVWRGVICEKIISETHRLLERWEFIPGSGCMLGQQQGVRLVPYGRLQEFRKTCNYTYSSFVKKFQTYFKASGTFCFVLWVRYTFVWILNRYLKCKSILQNICKGKWWLSYFYWLGTMWFIVNIINFKKWKDNHSVLEQI